MDTTTMMRRRNLRVTEQLLGELEAKRFDSALTRRILEAPSAFPRLLRACFLAQDGKLARARADVDDALGFANPNPVVGLVAGMVLFATHDYQRAIDLLDQVASAGSGGAAQRARRQSVGITTSLAWDHDTRATIEAAIATEPEPIWHAEAVRLFARGRHWQQALDHAVRALELEPHSARMWMEAAGLHARLDHRAQAVDAATRAVELARAHANDERPYLREGARVACDAGEFELARRWLARGLELEPTAAELHVELAELALWKGDDGEAEAAAARALAIDPELGGALRVRGALAVRGGRFDDAQQLLRAAIERDPADYRAHVWLAEASLRLGDWAGAHAHLHRAAMAADGFLVVAWLLRLLAVAGEEQRPDEILTANRTEEFELALRELVPELAARALASMRCEELREAVEAGLAAVHGNRSVYPTHIVDGALTRLHARTGCRYDSRWALQLIRVATREECLAEFDEIIARYPGSSLPLCHRGELHLWLGEFEAARADLEAAIAAVEGTRWAYMGLSTIDLVGGDYQACLDRNAQGVRVMQNTEGPAIHVFRGEALRKLGRVDEAIAELSEAVEAHPARASATINLALCFLHTGERAGFDRLWRRLVDVQAPGLLSDAARELGLTIVGDDDWEPDDADKRAVLERALELFGGNRSSGLLSYRTGEGRLRFVPVWSPGGAGPHANDHAQLEAAKRILLKALAHYKGPRPP